MSALAARLGDTLLARGWLDADQLDIAQAEVRAGRPLEQALAQLGFVPDGVLRDTLAELLGLDSLEARALVADSTALADAVDIEVADQLQTTTHRARVTAALSGKQSATVLVDDVEQGVRVVNAYAAEHLEIQTDDAAAVALQIRSAGAIFVGAYSPVSLGDYCAGSNHVLPTAGCARHSSGLSVQTFLKGIHIVDYDEAALKDVAGDVIVLAKAENLPAHGEAVRRRFER